MFFPKIQSQCQSRLIQNLFNKYYHTYNDPYRYPVDNNQENQEVNHKQIEWTNRSLVWGEEEERHMVYIKLDSDATFPRLLQFHISHISDAYNCTNNIDHFSWTSVCKNTTAKEFGTLLAVKLPLQTRESCPFQFFFARSTHAHL